MQAKKNDKQKKNSKNSTKKISVPAAKGEKISSSAGQFLTSTVRNPKKYPGAIRVRGHEYLGAIATTSATTGSNLTTILLNPLSFTGTRLRAYGELYDKYLFTSFTLHYTSADPSTATGQYILAYDRDFADDTPPASTQGIREYFAMAGSVISNVWSSTSFKCPLADAQEFYYTNDTGYEGRIVFQGQLYAAAVSGTTFHGSMWIEYDLELYDPSLETAPSTILDIFGGEVSLAENGSLFDDFGKLESFANGTPRLGFDTALAGGFGGSNGLVLPPGSWIVQIGLNNKTDAVKALLNFNYFLYKYDRSSRSTGSPDTAVNLWSGSDVQHTPLEFWGFGNTSLDTNLGMILQIYIPVHLGMLWLFITVGTAAAAGVSFSSGFANVYDQFAIGGFDAMLKRNEKYTLEISKEEEETRNETVKSDSSKVVTPTSGSNSMITAVRSRSERIGRL